MADPHTFATLAEVDLGAVHATLAQRRPRVTVVVPVYNGGDFVRTCLTAVLEHTDRRHRLLVIDDGGDDPVTGRLLDELAAAEPVELVRHPVNLGYTRTAAHGIELAGDDDVVLLNSDTVVGPLWLQRLTWVAYSDPRTGTVSAVSDDAAANSVPLHHQHNDWYPRLPWSATARLMARGMKVWSQQVPSAHGFCMLVRRDLLDEVGGLDVESFPLGYGEEVDLSRRALAAGRHSVVAPHVLVKHLRSRSFGAQQRQELVAAAKVVLLERYPDLTHDVDLWEASVGSALVTRNAGWIRTSWRVSDPEPESRVVVVEHGPDGCVRLITVGRDGRCPVRHDEWCAGAPLVDVGPDDRDGLHRALVTMAVLNAVETIELRSVDPEVRACAREVADVLGLAFDPDDPGAPGEREAVGAASA